MVIQRIIPQPYMQPSSAKAEFVLPRPTGEGDRAKRGGGGVRCELREGGKKHPLRPLRGHLPRETGEESASIPQPPIQPRNKVHHRLANHCPRRIDSARPHLLQNRHIIRRDHAADDDHDVGPPGRR
jgi:hypothetical protein